MPFRKPEGEEGEREEKRKGDWGAGGEGSCNNAEDSNVYGVCGPVHNEFQNKLSVMLYLLNKSSKACFSLAQIGKVKDSFAESLEDPF